MHPPCLDVRGVEPQIGPVTFKRTVEKSLHPPVDLLAETGDLALGDAAHVHGLDQIVDGPCGNTLDVGFLDHRHQGLLGGATRLQEERQITALAELGDRQGNGAGSGLPGSLAIAIAVVGTLCVTLAVASAAKPIHLQRHQTVGSKRDQLA